MIHTSLPDEMYRPTNSDLTPMSHFEFRQTDDDAQSDNNDSCCTREPAPFSFPENGADLTDWLETARLERLEDYSRKRSGSRFTDGPDYTYEQTDHGYLQIHDEYDLVTSSWYDSQREVANAWAAMEYPRRNADSSGTSRLQCSANFEGVQHADGSGVLMHYSTTEAWRTRSLLVINNADCWSRGFAHCTPPRNMDLTLSRTLMERLLREGPTDDRINAIVDVYDHDSHRVLTLESGGAIVFWTDPTAHAPRCAVVLERGYAAPHARSDYATILDELKPKAVKHSPLPVRDADAAGDDPEIPGGYILRQGEWFFIPCDPDFEPDRVFDPHERTLDKFLGNHEPRDFGIENVANRHNVYVRGWVSHPRDHERAYLGERWYYACESPIDHVRVLDDPEHRSRSSSRSGRGMRYD